MHVPTLVHPCSVCRLLACRGTLVLFAAILTIVLLKRRLHSHHYLGVVLVCAGAALVGASSIIYQAQPPDPGHAGSSSGSSGGVRRLFMLEGLAGGGVMGSNVALGNVLVVVAQVRTQPLLQAAERQ